ncbi:hypothetical protein A3C23_01795 [Candidatus Roizmanbacteria bacterium RIFCSPHIGHO2_02_FULL_37_13b]|uniref:GHMP kinase N-terminal domain-containing protein n=1 Tax=Candidatus Roizmanbacteria bacterium RIFCSPLOWO2_02_FULL_36_11 TaxID=1802071 RepID=A0A1F7JCX8_9BACT|nr:MAG: hypothetical protein A3C23_01795 [Candidatus Roizmanbacteria bacterium RIFCSPHIGHO2_02_FULL_37_13b]OGK53468.1 MAG: hypothetical protein A3H78_02955 [Candidatus Roizmanbacteria bacterium RIFCSPLOWO2_02_FULL_36_11]
MIITKTPMRITLAGGGTDVLWYSRLHGGAWISAAIDKYVYIFLTKNKKAKESIISDGFNQYKIKKYTDIQSSIVRECFKLVQPPLGLDIRTISEVSAKSGLGGSGAFEVGLLHALYKYNPRGLTRFRPIEPSLSNPRGLTQSMKIEPRGFNDMLARQAADIEIVKLQKPVGPQDQYITALGGIKYFEIDKSGKVSYQDLKLSKKTIDRLEQNLIFFQTGILHDTGKIHGEAKKKMMGDSQDKNKIIDSLDRIKELGLKAKQYLVNGDVDKFGSTFHDHWLIKKKLSAKVSSVQIDEWYTQGMKAGALGGKIMGAGGGGWFVFYVNKNHEKFRAVMQKKGLIPRFAEFDWKGSKVYHLRGVIK